MLGFNRFNLPTVAALICSKKSVFLLGAKGKETCLLNPCFGSPITASNGQYEYAAPSMLKCL